MAEKGRTNPDREESRDELRAFLVGLATDPAQLGRFVRDPEGTMTEGGLSAADQAILGSGDPGAINARLAGGPGAASPAVVLVVDVASGAGGEEQVTVRANPQIQLTPQIQFPLQFPQQFPVTQQFPLQFPLQFPVQPQLVIHPQQVVHPQVVIHPQQVVHPQLVIHPQQVVHPQLVIHPQQVVHPQLVIHPQQVVHPQILPQITPLQVLPQVAPQILPQITPLQVLPQVAPQILPQITPLQVLPQVAPQILPQITPMLQFTPGQ